MVYKLNNLEDSINLMISETGLMRTEIEKILLIFFDSIYNLVEELEASLRKNDYNIIQKIAHKIKGASGNLRLDWISKIADELELASKNRDFDACMKSTEKLSFHINQISACI